MILEWYGWFMFVDAVTSCTRRSRTQYCPRAKGLGPECAQLAKRSEALTSKPDLCLGAERSHSSKLPISKTTYFKAVNVYKQMPQIRAMTNCLQQDYPNDLCL